MAWRSTGNDAADVHSVDTSVLTANTPRLIGFEGIGENDNVPTSAVEAWLQNSSEFNAPSCS